MAEHDRVCRWRAFGVLATAAALLLSATGASGTPAAGQTGDGEDGEGPWEGLSIEVDPSTDLSDTQPVTVTVTGVPDRFLLVMVCDATVGPATPMVEIANSCDYPPSTVPAGQRPYQLTHTVSGAFNTWGNHSWVDCWEAPAGCKAIVTGNGDGGLPPFASTPLEFGPQPLGVRVTGPDVVRPGDLLPVEVTGVRSEPVGVALCAGAVSESQDVFDGPCGPTATIAAGDDPVEVDLVATHYFEASDGSVVECGPGDPPPCVVAVGSADRSAFTWAPVHYLDVLQVLVTPSADLVDGQVVELAGYQIPPSYEGPPFWVFPSTGGWSVAQCDKDVGPTILSVFTYCALPPGGPLLVDNPSESVSVPVQATMTRILGGTTDCATWETACVLALIRIDAMGQVEMHRAYIGFPRD